MCSSGIDGPDAAIVAVRARVVARATGVKNSRYALWKSPENLTENQKIKLAWIVQIDPTLGRAYYLKEGRRTILKQPYCQAGKALDERLSRARRDRARPLQRARQVFEHEDQTHHPHRIQIKIIERPHRPRHAQPGWPQTTLRGRI